MKIKHFTLLTLLIGFISGLDAKPARAEENSPWLGEWGNWEKSGAGAGLRIREGSNSVSFDFASEDGNGHSCRIEGTFESASEADAKGFAKKSPMKKRQGTSRRCTLAFSQNPVAGNRATRIGFEGRDCARFCDSEKALTTPPELPLIQADAFAEPAPWPRCQKTDENETFGLLCRQGLLAKVYLEVKDLEKKRLEIQNSFYAPKIEAHTELPDPLPSCEGAEDKRACLEASIKKWETEQKERLTKIRQLKIQHESDLKAPGPSSPEAREAAAALKGTYSKKVRLGTNSGEKFDATDDIKLGAEADELSFDLLLNFFDEKECNLNGTAKALKSGRFLYRERAKGSHCALLIFKEGADLVVADDPPQSCRTHCGKGGSFFGARFPLSSKK